MKNFPTFHYYYNPKSTVIDVLLQGGSYDINSPFMQRIFDDCKEFGHSVVAFNFLYFDRGEEHSSGPELKEELETIQRMLDFTGYKNYKRVRVIGKSLGGLVGSYYLSSISKEEQSHFEIVILGYLTGDVRLHDFSGEITIIQGEKDKHGNIEAVKKTLEEALSKDIAYYEIPNADHSYKDPATDKPIYQNKVFKILKNLS